MKREAVTATLWSGLDVGLRQVFTFILSIVLARLLAPEEFGIYALLSLFTAIATVISQGGFSAALIQKKDATYMDECTVFWAVLILSLTVGLCFVFCGPLFAQLYSKPILIPLSIIAGINVFIASFGSIQTTLFTKRLQFKAQMVVALAATVLSGAVAIYGAWSGWGVWALALQSLTSTITYTLGIWLISKWRPSFSFSLDSLRALWGFGGAMAAVNLLDVAYNRFYTLLIGKLYGVAELGFYNRAVSVRDLPTQSVGNLLLRAAFPIFSKAADDLSTLRKGLEISVKGLALVNVPIMLGLSVTSHSLIHVLYGEKWLPVAPILQILALSGVLWPIQAVNLNALMALGHSKLFLKLEIIKKLIGLVLTVVGAVFFGIIGLAWFMLLSSIISFFINTYYSQRFLSYGFLRQFLDILPLLSCAGVMAFSVAHLSGWLPVISPIAHLFLLVVTGVLIYVTLCFTFRLEALRVALETWRAQ